MIASNNLYSQQRVPEETKTMSLTQPYSPLRNAAPTKGNKAMLLLARITSPCWKKGSSSHAIISATNSKDSPRRTALSRSGNKNQYRFPFPFVVFGSTVAATFFTVALVQYTMLTNNLERISQSNSPSIIVADPSRFHRETTKGFKRNFPPRVVTLPYGGHPRENNIGSLNSHKFSSNYLLPYSSNRTSNQIYRVPYTIGNCTPIAAWQVDSKPNCNTMHEIDVPNFVISNLKKRSRLEEGSIAYLGQGWFRMAWKLHTGLATAIPKDQKQNDVDYNDGYQDYIESHYQNALSPPVILKTLR